jgi:methylenetetrahydrofolate reductase (NADPH)
MAHLTCAAHTRADLVAIVERYREAGVDNILALGGDPPAGLDLPPGELTYAAELVELVREVGDFSVGVAAHPEGHPSSSDLEVDRRHLATKMAAADFAVSQFFFRCADYERLVDDLARLGCTKPVLPGIMPITNLSSVSRMAAMSGAAIPPEVLDRVSAVGDDPHAVSRVGVELATELCSALLAAGAPGLHFFTLNRSSATREIFANLGLDPGR